MADYLLVPVDYQPDFDGVSLVPVDHDPFGADGVTQPQPTITDVDQANVSAAANSMHAPEEGESWNPDSENGDHSGPNPSNSSTRLPGNMPFKPFGELKPATFTPTQRIGNLAADAATALGMQPYTANDLAKRIGNVLGLVPPIGLAGSAVDVIDAAHRGDLPGVLTTAPGLIPGVRGLAKGVAQGVAESVGSGRALAREAIRAAESPEILSQELEGKTRSQIRDLATDKGLVPKGNPLDPDFPRRWSDPVTSEQRLRLDRGHVDKKTGQPYANPNGAADHVHAYDLTGNPIEVNGDRHVPTTGE